MAEFTNTNIQGKLYFNNINFLDIVYPIGSIYISTKSTNPNTLFGGTWEAIQDRVLFAGSATNEKPIGDTGGSKYLAAHSHGAGAAVTISSSGAHTHNGYYSGKQKTGGSYCRMGHSGSYKDTNTMFQYPQPSGAHTHSIPAHNTNATGTANSEEYTNMPPYLVVYMWKRTA